jgi:hypothetical protein
MRHLYLRNIRNITQEKTAGLVHAKSPVQAITNDSEITAD